MSEQTLATPVRGARRGPTVSRSRCSRWLPSYSSSLLGTQLSHADSHAAMRKSVLGPPDLQDDRRRTGPPGGCGRSGRYLRVPVGLRLDLGLAANSGARHTHVMSEPRLTSHRS